MEAVDASSEFPEGDEALRGAEDPGKKEKGEAEGDHGGGDFRVEPEGEMVATEGAKNSVEDGDDHHAGESLAEEEAGGSGQDEHADDHDAADGFEGADDDDREPGHEPVLDPFGRDADGGGEGGVEGGDEEFFVEEDDEADGDEGDEGGVN